MLLRVPSVLQSIILFFYKLNIGEHRIILIDLVVLQKLDIHNASLAPAKVRGYYEIKKKCRMDNR